MIHEQAHSRDSSVPAQVAGCVFGRVFGNPGSERGGHAFAGGGLASQLQASSAAREALIEAALPGRCKFVKYLVLRRWHMLDKHLIPVFVCFCHFKQLWRIAWCIMVYHGASWCYIGELRFSPPVSSTSWAWRASLLNLIFQVAGGGSSPSVTCSTAAVSAQTQFAHLLANIGTHYVICYFHLFYDILSYCSILMHILALHIQTYSNR